MFDNATDHAEYTATLLSENAQKLYKAVTDYLRYKNVKDSWIDDNWVSRSSRLTLPKLSFAQSELSRTGLLVLAPGTGQTRYILPDDNEAEQL
jgi:hypothetical protein